MTIYNVQNFFCLRRAFVQRRIFLFSGVHYKRPYLVLTVANNVFISHGFNPPRTSPIAPRFSRLRSFSVLRRLKTWLRSTMSVAHTSEICGRVLCHVNQDLLDACDFDNVIELFISTCDSRIKLLGK